MAPPPTNPLSPPSTIVLGAGIIGLCSALQLQSRGHEVTLISRALPDGGVAWREAASFGNACTIATQAIMPVSMPGLVRQLPQMLFSQGAPLALRWQYLPQMMPWLFAFLRAGRAARIPALSATLTQLLGQADAAWQEVVDRVGARHLVREKGCVYVYKTAAEAAAAKAVNRRRIDAGQRLSHYSAEDLAALEPNLARGYHSAVGFDDSWSFDSPAELARLMLQSFVARGGKVVAGQCEGAEAGAAGVVVRAKGEVHRAASLVVACGAWSRQIARQLGEDVLLDTERGYHVLFPEAGHLISRPVCYPSNGFFMVPMADGLRAAGTVELGGLRAPATPSRTQMIRQRVAAVLPEAGRSAPEEWLGFRSSMPDSLPVISRSARHANVAYAFGHGHIGLTLAAVTGRLVAEILTGAPERPELAALRINRFSRLGLEA